MASQSNEQDRQRVEVLEIKPIPQLIFDRDKELRCARRGNQVRHHEEDEQRTVIERKNAQHPARVENAEIVGAALGIVENPCDQKSRQHEEEVDARPAHQKHVLQEVRPHTGRMLDLHRHVQHDDQERG